jgi:hypothetical protein
MTAPDQTPQQQTNAETVADLDDQLAQSERRWHLTVAFVALVGLAGVIGWITDDVELASLLDLLITGFGLVGIGHTVHAHGIRQQRAHRLRWLHLHDTADDAAAQLQRTERAEPGEAATR